jgi:hypothetical protein
MTDPNSSILRVLNKDKTVVGAAFLVTDRLVVTCAHVIEAVGLKMEGTVDLKLEDGTIVDAQVIGEYWRDVNAEDVAILRLEKSLNRIQPLILSPSVSAMGHSFSTYGFPNELEEFSGQGDIIGPAVLSGVKVLQLRSPEVTPGFSGAPIFDESNKYLKRVVGMVVSITPPDRYQRLGTTAFATPSEMLHKICPELPIEATLEAMGEELLTLAGMDIVDLSIVRKVYSLCFDGITLLEPIGNKAGVRERILHLTQATSLQESQARPLAYFTATLADRLRPVQPELTKLLLVWLKNHAITLLADPNNLGALIRIDKDQINPPCLQLILELYPGQPNDDPKTQQYILRARDGRNEKLLISDLKSEFHKLAANTRATIKMYQGQLEADEADIDEKLWIEFCLPTSDLSRKVEQWKFDEESGKTLGQSFKVVVRSRYRWEKRFDLRKTWPNKWSACKAAITNQLSDLNIEVVTDATASSLKKAVENAQVLGLPFELRDDETSGNLLTTLLDSGVPVVIWVRGGVDTQIAEQWLRNQIHANLDLRHLAEHVRLERQAGSNLGKALVLLWDNYDHKLGEEDHLQAPSIQDEEVLW